MKWNATLPERFARCVATGEPEECWPWTGGSDRGGYGVVHLYAAPGSGASVKGRAHRVAVALAGVEVGPDDHVHHRCGNPRCVNPAHLAVLPMAAHKAEHHGEKRKPRERGGQGTCSAGHDLSVEGVRQRGGSGLACLACHRERQRERRRRRALA